jgi:hypothetical protein
MINGGRTAFLSVPGMDGLLEGGVPILVDGQCVGAVGVSGVKSNEDAQIARAGVAALEAAVKKLSNSSAPAARPAGWWWRSLDRLGGGRQPADAARRIMASASATSMRQLSSAA